MSSLVTADQVMGMPMIVGAHTFDEVQLALDWASESIESYCERKFAYNESDTVFVNPHRGNGGHRTALLPNPPVWNVSQVLAQVPLPLNAGLTWVPLPHVQFAEDGLIYDVSRYFGAFSFGGVNDFWSTINADGFFFNDGVPNWPTLPRSLQVTYAHGFSLPGSNVAAPSNIPPLPSGLVSAVIRGAAFYLDNPNSVSSSHVGEISNNFINPTGPAGWLDEKLLGQYRLVNL